MALVVFFVLSLCITCCKVDGRNKFQPDEENDFTQHNSIMLPVDNNFDCVDIYKQPTLQHPLLKNHNIQLSPTFAKNTAQSSSSYGEIVNGCPEGKVPIYNKTKRHQNSTNSSFKLQTNEFWKHSKSFPGYNAVTLDTTQNMIFHGAFTGIAGFNLSLQDNQYSISSIWIESGPPTELNSIKLGVGVHPSLFGDSQLRLIGSWTADGYKKTGCYNLLCSGFVQVNKEYAFGSVISPANTIGSTSKYITFLKIKQDRSTGHWWLTIQLESIQIGYWPKELFTHLSKGASLIRFGGQTLSPPNKDSPPMGSGRLPKEKYRNSAFMEKLQIIDLEYNEVDVKSKDMKPYKDTNSDCYDLMYHGYEGPVFKQAFLYGGPGGRNCDI
ncbi:uncharacterized protein LOC127106109 isoform X3 [Lathyrus oleraceus]|uniref:Neprosin PEP catalytic domain-containing protein n=1 Tax=Pisum sativum TaxID=3888 RepID=A0A9D4VHA0_PEA|nr:uncharacterized protein LOC127106109 isoform X1 [Pisum sativum]XP_050899351.1 uncharacterized protein LOC127106109 isoform X3 [Pisum sativum]KAI5383516.1 hypothetical protein KIW84_070773 [Pisum sativum]